tara:strand:+ start:44804 stop:45163 length:360 start_codon:yes stop_codon:yes gene_type:complete
MKELATVKRNQKGYVLKIGNVIFAREGDSCPHKWYGKQWTSYNMKQTARRINRIAKEDTVFTTTQVSEILKVSSQTVVRWCNEKKIKCYRIPGSRNRQITLASLKLFMSVHGFPESLLR